MSEAVDTRIVEAKFDSAQFEKGVDRTVKKLDELKKSLNLEEAGKSVAQLADKTKDATEKASSALEKLENSFTNFTGMLRQKLLSGIADEVVGVFFKIKNGFESLVNSLSSAQVSVGMSKYEQMLTSVRTMIAAGDTEDAAYNAIETLGAYADQTSYSLDQMTSALSKMRAAGVDLETGTKAVEGISNACAAAGVNATDASRAFFNLAQAYSSGYLKYTDYRSLELLNMTTEKFKIQMLDAAEAAGTLKKLSDGVYQTVNKNDKKVSAGKKITVKNLSEALKYNFMNTEAMNKLFGEGFFFDEKEWKQIKAEAKAAGKSEEEALALAKERFGDVAVNAYFAAREARSFTDVMGTLKDVISRGWSTSFELIFGRLEEATKFFTALTESNLANAIYNISEFRNQILQHWSDSGGRDNLLKALENIDNLLGRILGHFTIFSDSEGDQFQNTTRRIGHQISQASRDFRRFTEALDAWFTEERIARIQKVVGTIGTVLSTVFRALGIAFNFATKIFETFEPVLGKIIDNVDKVVNRINSIFNAGKRNNKTKDGLDSLEMGLDNVVTALEPLVKPLEQIIDFLGDVASFLIEIASGTFISNLDFLADTLGFIIELFGGKSSQQKIKNGGVGVLDGLKKSIIELGDACKDTFNFVKDFFHNLYEDILLLLGIHELPEGEEGGFFTNIQKFFDTSEFLKNVGKWFEELPDKINRIIYGNKKYRNKKENGKVVGLEAYYEGGLINSIKDVFEKVKSWIAAELPKEIRKIWNTIDEFFFGKKVGFSFSLLNKFTGKNNDRTIRVKSGFSKWLENTINSIKTWFKTELPKAISELWNTIDEFIFGRKVEVMNKDPNNPKSTIRVKEGFSAWLETAIEDVKTWIASIPEKITNLWNTIIDFIFYRDPQPDEVNPETGEKYGPTDRVKNGFRLWLEALPSKIWTWMTTDLPELVKKIWNAVLDFVVGPKVTKDMIGKPIPGTDKTYGPNDRVKTAFITWIENLPSNIWGWITGDLPTIVANIWENVLDFIIGPKVTKDQIGQPIPGTEDTYGPNDRVKNGFYTWIEGVAKNIKGWINSAPTKISEIWDTVLGMIFGEPQESKDIGEQFDQDFYDKTASTWGVSYAEEYKKQFEDNQNKNSILQIAEKFVKDLGLDIGKILSNLPAHIVEGWNFSLGLADTFFEKLTGFFSRRNEENNAEQAISESTEDIVNNVADAVKDESTEAGPLLTAIVTFGSNIKKMVTTTIPGLLSEGFTYVTTKGIPDLGNAIIAIFGLEPNWWDNFDKNAEEFGTNVAEKIKKIPDNIREGIQAVKDYFSGETELKKIRKDIRKQFTVKDDDGNPVIVDPEGLKVALNAAENEFRRARKSSGLWDAIKEIFGATGDVVKELGPDILNTINGVFEWIGEQLGKATIYLDESHAQGKTIDKAIAEKLSDENSEGYSLYSALQTIGATIKRLIVDIIPGFIRSAIDEVSMQVPKIFSGLFSGENGEDVGSTLVTSLLGDSGSADSKTESTWATYAGKILQDRLEQVRDVFAEVNAKSSNKKILRSEAIQNVKDAIDSTWTEIGKLDPEKNKDRIDQLNANIKAYESMLDELQNSAPNISELQEKIDDAWVEIGSLEPGIDQERINQLRDDIKAYTDMIEALTNGDFVDASKYDVNNETNIANVAKSGEKTEKAITSFLGSFQGIVDTITSVGTSKLGQITMLIAAVGLVLFQIKDMLSITDEVEGFGYTAKWEGIKIAILGIVAIMGWVTYLAQKSDQTQIDNTLAAFDRITEMISKLAEMFAWIAGLKMGSNVFEMIGSIFDYKEAKNLVKAGKAAETGAGFFTSLLQTVTGKFAEIGIFAIGSDIIGGGIESLGESLGAVFQSIGIGVEQFSEFAVPAIDSLASILTKIDDAIQTVNKISELLTALNGVVGAVDLAKAINEDIGGVGNSELTVDDLEKSAISVMGRVTSRMSVIYSIGSMLNSLSKGITEFDELEDPTNTLKKMIAFVSGSDESGKNLFKSFIQTMVDAFVDIDWRTDFSKVSDVGYGLEFLANALSIFGMGIADLDEANVTALDKTLDVFIKMSEALGAGTLKEQSLLSKLWSGDSSLSNFGSEVQAFGSHMKSFVRSVNSMSGMSESEIDLTQRRLEVVVNAASGLADSASKLHLGDMAALDEFKDRLTGYGSNLASFVNAVNTSMDAEINLDKMQTIEVGAKALSDLMQGIGALNNENYSGNIPTLFSDFMKAISENLEGVYSFYNLGLDAGSNLDAGLAKGIETGKAIDAAQTLADTIKGIFPFVWQERSPSKLAELYARYWDEGLANGFENNSDKPVDAVGSLAKDVIDEAQSILNDSNSSLGDKSYARSVLDQMFGIGDHKFGQELKKEYADVVEDTVQTINSVTDAEWNKLQKQDSYFDVLMKSVKSVWNQTFGREDNTTALKSLLYRVPENPEIFMDSESGLFNFVANGMVWLGDKLEEASREYIPNLATLFLDNGLLSSDKNSMVKVFSAIESMTEDVSLYTDNLWVKFASDLAGAYKIAFEKMPEGDKASGWEIAKALFSNISSTIGEYARAHGGIFSEIFAYTKDLDIGKIFGGIDTAVPAFMDYLSSLGTKLGQPIVNFASDTMSSIYEALLMESDGEDGTTVVGKLLNNLISAFSEHVDDEGISGEVASKMLEIFNIADAITENGTDLTPKITPILEISDDFRNTANQIGQLLGFNELLQMGENGTLTVNNTSMGLAEQLAAIKGTDYSALMQEIISSVGNLQQGIDGFGVKLGSMKFIINGKEFAYTIGPDINEYLGYEDATRGGRYATWVQEMES